VEAPRSTNWLRLKVNRDTEAPNSSWQHVEQYSIPNSLNVAQKVIEVLSLWKLFKKHYDSWHQVRHNDILAQAANLLASPLALEGFMDSASKPATEYGERVYDELNTGDWWNDTVKMKEMPKVVWLIITFYCK
jgi:hypothetical protein